MELIQRLLQAIGTDQAPDEESTPRRRFACFLEQLVATRVLDRQNRRAHCHGANPDLDQPSGPVHAHAHVHTQAADASFVVPEPPHAPTTPHSQDKQPQFDLTMHDMAFVPVWDPHTVHPDQMQQFFAFSETELMPAFMAFPDQTSSWFM